MSELPSLISNIINENLKSDDNDYIFYSNFMNQKEYYLLAKKYQTNGIDYAQVWICEYIGDKEFDVYSFLIALKQKMIAIIKKGADDETDEYAKKEIEKKLIEKLKKDNIKVRDIYVGEKSVRTELKNVNKDEDKIKNELIEIIWKNKINKKEQSQNNSKKDKQNKAKNITAMLKKIATDDNAFNEVVKLFDKIKTLAENHKQDFDYALKTINNKLASIEKEDK